MPRFRWGRTFGALQDLEREMDRLLQSVNFTFQGVRARRQYPAVNIYETEDEYLLTAELPGTHPDDLELSVASGMLTMKGKRTDVREDDENLVPEDNYRRRERQIGSWERSLTLPERVQEEKMEAEFVDGSLCLHLPKVEEQKPRQIPVFGGSES